MKLRSVLKKGTPPQYSSNEKCWEADKIIWLNLLVIWNLKKGLGIQEVCEQTEECSGKADVLFLWLKSHSAGISPAKQQSLIFVFVSVCKISYWNEVFDLLISFRRSVCAACKIKKQACWDSREIRILGGDQSFKLKSICISLFLLMCWKWQNVLAELVQRNKKSVVLQKCL